MARLSIRKLLGSEGLWQDFIWYRQFCSEPTAAYYYVLYLNGYLTGNDVGNWMIFQPSEEEKKVLKLKEKNGSLYFSDDGGFPEFYELSEEEVDHIIWEETERFKEEDFFEQE